VRAPHEMTVAAGGSAGKTIGRYANRIARGELPLDGTVYSLLTNENGNTLHGGPDGFSKREWALGRDASGRSAKFSLVSDDGDQGFPGRLEAHVMYSWSDEDELTISYLATVSEKPTVVNFTNHVYFNLRGDESSVAEYVLQVNASEYVVVDSDLIPTGEIAPVAGTGLDFRQPEPLGERAIDRNFAIDGWDGSLRLVGQLSDPRSGYGIDVSTTLPGFQLYTGKPGAVAMEMQHFPDAPHHDNFPSTVLRPGERFEAAIVYRFTGSR
ncbi:MAG TPA: aldose epimerase family protein, partial [Candidatus Baltobacteraceae bacterium]|nr:aldose epimerase family protein [Candidatus Baltobacteraceae bacterium]